MAENWIGMVASGASVSCVCLNCDGTNNTLIAQFSWSLQSGDRPPAYQLMYERVRNYIRENNISNAVIKASAVGQTKATLSHLHSAELRGVIAAAANAGGASVFLIGKATISRTYGERKADDYIEDDNFWTATINGDLARGRREAALLILSRRGA